MEKQIVFSHNAITKDLRSADFKKERVNKKMRDSGVELLRIIAILLICLSHSLDTSRSFIDYSATYEFGTNLLKILMASGQIGNVLFIICSAYFLIDSTKTKADKAFNLLFDSALISIIMFFGFMIGGYSFNFEDGLRQFLPDIFEHNWFIGIYVLMYIVHPLLNKVIYSMGQKAHFTFCFIIFVFFGILGLVLGDEIAVGNLAHFIMVYFIVAYMKLYCSDFANDRKKNIKWFLITLVIFFVVGFLDCFLPVWNSYLSRFVSMTYWFSPVFLPMLLFLFNIFRSFTFKSKIINYIASLSLFVYLIHENILIRGNIRPKFFEWAMGVNPNMYFWWVMLCTIISFVGGIILSIIYKETLHRFTAFASKKFANGVSKLRDLSYAKFHKNKVQNITKSFNENDNIVVSNGLNLPQEKIISQKMIDKNNSTQKTVDEKSLNEQDANKLFLNIKTHILQNKHK